MKLHRLSAVLMLLGVVLLGAMPTAAQESGITVEVQAGYQGSYRSGDWFPVDIIISNDGPDFQATLEWSFPAGGFDEAEFRQTIDLPRGSRKHVTLNVVAHNFVQNGLLRVLDGNTERYKQVVSLDGIEPARLMIGIVSSDPTILNSLNSLTTAGGVSLHHIDPANLPNQATALRGLDVLFLHDLDSSTLQSDQRAAIELWTSIGGQLVLSGGLNGMATLAGFADLAPVEVTGLAQGSLTALQQIASKPFDSTMVTETALSQVTPREKATGLPSQSPLIYQWAQGSGTVFFTTFDLAALRGWSGEVNLWEDLLSPDNIFAPGAIARQQRSNPLQDVLIIPSLNLPSTTTLLIFMLVYILCIGPLNYLLLRRLGRAELAWVTIPVLVLIFTASFYFIGFGLRGSDSQVHQITLVQGSEENSRAISTSFIGLFSPRRTSYTVSLPPETLVSEARSFNDQVNAQTVIATSDADVEAQDVLLEVGAVRTFISENTVDLPIQVQSNLGISRGTINGSISNLGNQTLEQVVIVRGDNFWELGTLAPGASVTLPTAPMRSFPGTLNLPPTDTFDRKQLMLNLFDSFPRFRRATTGQLTTPETYLLAWLPETALPVQVNGQTPQQDGTTLYVIHLNP